ncbi:Hydroxynitrilase [Dactylella cylindrospora]|nr:Hydroxynitrilase [Dactylella cylindrospora]
MKYDVPGTPTPFPKSAPITFVLIHGAWHSGSSWDNVRPYLESAGHIVHTPTIGGLGKGATPVHTLDEGVKPILDYIEEKGLKDFVLLGHSFGGVIITHIATQIPDKIKRIVYQNAFVCDDGQGLWDIIPEVAQNLYEDLAAKSGNGTFPCPFPIFRDAFIGDVDLAFAEEVYSTLSPQPIGLWKGKIRAGDFYTNPKIPRSVILARDDVTTPTGTYEEMAKKLGIFRMVGLPGSHEVMFSDPEALARACVIAGRD